MKLKDFFIKEDGSFRVVRVVIIFILLVIFLSVYFYLYSIFTSKNITKGSETIEQDKEVQKIDLCKNCSMKFIYGRFVMPIEFSSPIEEVFETTNISAKNVTFTSSDETVAKITHEKNTGKVIIQTFSKEGEATITAKYQELSAKMTVSVEHDGTIRSVKLLEEPYYFYLGENEIELNSVPSVIYKNDLNITIEDENIATFENGKIVAHNLGETKIKLSFDTGELDEHKHPIFIDTEQVMYVINTKINIQVKENNKCVDYSEYTASYRDEAVILCVSFDESNKNGYTSNDIKHELENSGNFQSVIDYDGKIFGKNNAYYYKVTLNRINTQDKTGVTKVTLSLPDESTGTIIIKEN